MGKWEIKKLGKIAEKITKGTTPTTNGYKYQKEGIGFVKVENLNENEIDIKSIEFFITDEANKAQSRSILKEDDLLFSIAGTIGKIALVKKEDLPLNTNQALAIIRGYKDCITPDFLRFTLTSKVLEDTKRKARGGALQNISLTDLKEAEIPLPPLPEQQRIVKKLDGLFAKIDQAIGLLEDNIAHTQALMGSVLDEEFGKLKDKFGKIDLMSLCDKITDGSHHSPKAIEKGIPYVTVRDVSWEGKIDTINCKKISKSDFIELERNNCKPLIGDVLLSKDGTVGKVAIVDFDMDWVVLSSLAIIRPNKSKLNTSFLSWMLKTPIIQELAIGLKTGAAIKRIVLRTIKKIEIPAPKNIKEQQRISNYFDELNKPYQKILETQTQKLNHLKALKSSLLDQAFKGELLKEDKLEITKQNNKTSFKDIFESINYDYEVATVVLLTWQALQVNYGKKFIHKIFSNIQFMEELPVFEDLQFKENPWGMYCPILEKTIKNKTFIKFDDINDDRSVLSFNYKYLKEINHWMISEDENKDFVNRVKNMLSIYQKSLIDKSMDRIELFNTILQCMAILETDNFDAIRAKMQKWKMIEGSYKNKAEKFKPRETELMIDFVKEIKN